MRDKIRFGKLGAIFRKGYSRDGEFVFDNLFRNLAWGVSDAMGSPKAFTVVLLIIIVWAATGPYLNYGNGWQIFINTVCNVGVALMTLLIQNTQNRHAKSMQLKLNELIRAVEGARTHLVSLENLNEKELERLQQEFQRLSAGIKTSQKILERNERI